MLAPAAPAPFQTGPSLVGHWKFDENTGTTAADSTGASVSGNISGPTWAAGKIGASSLNFDGVDDRVSFTSAPAVSNNFTIAFWANPESTHQIDAESAAGVGGVSGQRYAFWPSWRPDGDSGAGVSVGTNGVSVYEHAASYMPAPLVYQGTISGWTHVAVVYENKQPKLYLNGVLVRTGLTSPRSAVWVLPQSTGGDVYGYFDGQIDDVRVYNGALTAAEVAAAMGSQPYGGTPATLPGTVQAENFDTGGEGVAYHDTTAGNAGGQYRTDTDVDITGNTSGYSIGWTIPGEWTKYTVDVATTDTYTLEAIVSTPYSGSAIHLEVDGVNVTGTMAVPNTGAYGWWQATSKPGVQLSAGRHELKFVVETGGFLIDSIRAVQAGPAAPSGLAASAASTSQVNLTWVDNSPNETGFKVERKTGAAGTFAQVATVGAGVTSFSDAGLSSSTQYFYRVRATNAGGDSGFSNEAGATTHNAAPAVSLTAPANGASFTAPASITLTANASDGDGTVSKVEFFSGTTLLGTSTSAPYSFTWNNVGAGSYTLTAKAYDNGGAYTTSSAVNVTVALSTVSIAATDANAAEPGSDTGVFTVSRTGSTAAALTVHYTFGGTAANGTDYAAIGSYVTIPAGAASQTVTVTPSDDSSIEGNETVTLALAAQAGYTVGSPSSATVTISDNDTNPPTAAITSPSAGSVFGATTTITINANASDSDGTVAKVEFYQGATKLGEDTTAPYSFAWQNVAAGSYSLTAKATDNSGATGTSAAVGVIVNAPPAVSVSSPVGGTYDTPVSFQMQASASDPDGSVTKVEFFRDGTLMGEDTAAPFILPWNDVPVGTYSLTARATDNYGAQMTSAAVVVTVKPPATVTITAPSNNQNFGVGENVTITANVADFDQPIYKVWFYRGSTKLGSDSSAPYGITWQNVPEGTHPLTAIAEDFHGAKTTSAPVSINVTGGFESAALSPSNRTGAGGVDPLSRNYNWSLPVVGLRGRAGHDLSLSLSYNSLVWTRSGASVVFDYDGSFPAPGFRLGFPALRSKFFNTAANKYSYLLVAPSGARAELRQTSAQGVYEAVDSSYLQLKENADQSLTLRATDGTQLTYWVIAGSYRCTQVKDRDGNFITVAYNNTTGNVEAVTDTAGRVVSFVYYADGSLEKITQTWRRETGTGAVITEAHDWATFYYENKTIQTNFTGLSMLNVQNGATFRALTKVKLADGSFFTFSYTTWGQVNRFEQHAGDGHLLNYASCDLPADQSTPQTDCPRFGQYRVWAEYWNGDADGTPAAAEEAVTSYEVTEGATWQDPDTLAQESGTLTKQTAADGTVSKQYAHATGWGAGLVRLSEVWAVEDGALKRQKWTSVKWTQDDTALAFPLNPRVEETNVRDDDNNRRRTRVTYTSFGLPQDVFEYADATNVLRRTHTEYLADSVTPGTPYTDRRIIGLPRETTVYGTEAGQEKLFSKVSYEYDLPGGLSPEVLFLTSAGTVTQHDPAYDQSFRVRGQLCRVRRWDVTVPTDEHQSLDTTTGYNTTGSAVFTADALHHLTRISYADSNGGSTLAYPTKVTDPEGFFSTAEYNYDLGAVVRSVDPKGAAQRTRYDAAGRVAKVWNEVNEAYTAFDYPASGRYLRHLTKVETNEPETFTMTVVDGAGRVRGSLRELPGSTGGYAAQRFGYDRMGRQVEVSNPAEVAVDQANPWNVAGWQPAGDDAPAAGQTGWLFTRQEFDWQGRPTFTTYADGTQAEVSYGGCGCAGGQVVTMKGETVPAPGTPDTGRRTQKVYHDVLGRVVKTEQLNWDGTVYSATTNRYNALDQLTRSRIYAGQAPPPESEPEAESAAYRTMTMSYDGHGRLYTRREPEQDEGRVSYFIYYRDDQLRTVTDARGVTTFFTYNARHLTTSVSYDLSAVTGVQTVEPASPVLYEYDAAGNRTKMTDGMGHVVYGYDTLSRLRTETRTFIDPDNAQINNVSKTITYDYALSGQPKSITDPFGTRVDYDYDRAGQLEAVTGSPYATGGANGTPVVNVSEYATGLKYRAWGALKSLDYGNGLHLSMSYTRRMRPEEFRLSGSTDLMRSKYAYYNDGRLKTVEDMVNSTYHRSYTYDHAGRVREAFSGAQALSFVATQPGNTVPYWQRYEYDAFGNVTKRENHYWSQSDTAVATYDMHDRRRTESGQANSYDAEGNILNSAGMVLFSYDGAGVNRSMTDGGTFYINQWADGSGQVVKKRDERHDDNGLVTKAEVSYYLRSALLGGAVLCDLDERGGAVKSRVYMGSEVLAELQPSWVVWKHVDPVTGTRGESNREGGFALSGEFYDPLGVNVGGGPPLTITEPQQPGAGEISLLGGFTPGRCSLDGITIDCAWARELMAGGSAVQCPDNDCGPRRRVVDGQEVWAFFQAFGDGFSGFLPAGAVYEGGGRWFAYVGGGDPQAEDPSGRPRRWRPEGPGDGFGFRRNRLTDLPINFFVQPQESGQQVSDDCLGALHEAQTDVDAIERAYASIDLLNRVAGELGVGSKILAAIAIRESGFLNISEKSGGKGRGIYQIDIGRNPGLEEIAKDPEQSARWVAKNFASNVAALRSYSQELGLTLSEDTLMLAGIRSHNAGLGSTKRNLKKYGADPDLPTYLNFGTARSRKGGAQNYVTNVADIIKHCLR